MPCYHYLNIQAFPTQINDPRVHFISETYESLFVGLKLPHSIKLVLKTDQLNQDYGPADRDSTYIISFSHFWISFKTFKKKNKSIAFL